MEKEKQPVVHTKRKHHFTCIPKRNFNEYERTKAVLAYNIDGATVRV